MLHRLPALVLVAALASGCAWNTIQPAMDGLVGKHVDDAIRYLGYPDEDAMLAGHRIISWYRRDSMTLPHTSSVTNPYTGTTMSMTSYSTANLACQIRVEVDADLIIRTWEGNGNEGACAHFASRLANAPHYVNPNSPSLGQDCKVTPDRWSKTCLLRKTK